MINIPSATETRKILKGLHLRSKDDVTLYADNHFSYRALSDVLEVIVQNRPGPSAYSGWMPRTTWLSEYRKALAALIKEAGWADKRFRPFNNPIAMETERGVWDDYRKQRVICFTRLEDIRYTPLLSEQIAVRLNNMKGLETPAQPEDRRAREIYGEIVKG